MKIMFSKKSFFAPLAGLFLLFFFSCENSVNENNIVGVGGYVFPEATAVSKSFVSQVYNYSGSKVFSVTTNYLSGWETVPFLKFDDVCKLIAGFNGRGYVPSVEGSLYKYNYDSAKTAALISAGWNSAWDNDTLYFDVDNQTVYSDDFTRIISSVNLINNGIGADNIPAADATTYFPSVAHSTDTTVVKAKERTVIKLGQYGLKMFVIDGVLYVPFQALATCFLEAVSFSFSGTDYYIAVENAGDDYATSRAYEFGRHPSLLRSRLMAEYNYRALCLAFDVNYSLKNERSGFGKDTIGLFNDSIFANGLGFDLLSTDTSAYDMALVRFLMNYIDDGHTYYLEPSMYQNYSALSFYNDYSYSVTGSRRNKLSKIRSEMISKRQAAGGSTGLYYLAEGGVDKLAVIVFDGFVESNPGSETDLEQLAQMSTYKFFDAAFSAIAAHSDIHNVVIDLSCNSGGAVRECLASLCYLCDNSALYIPVRNNLDKSITKYKYVVNEGTSLKKNYNFYVLTSGFSFSCGNLFPSVCKYQFNIPIVGVQSGGGACVVKPTQTTDGALFKTSSGREFIYYDTASNSWKSVDAGVPVDLEIDYDDFYSGSVLYANLYGKLKAAYPTNF